MKIYKQYMSLLLVTLMAIVSVCTVSASEEQNSVNIYGTLYSSKAIESDKGTYNYLSEDGQFNVNNSGVAGNLSVCGNVNAVDNNTIESFPKNEHETVKIVYNLNKYSTKNEDDNWYISSEDEKLVGKVDLTSKIKTGAFIVEMSRDGENWIVLKNETDILGKKTSDDVCTYEIQPIQMQNGAWFRVTIAYQLKRVKSTKKVWLATIKYYEYSKNVETYEFYIKDNSTTSNTSPETTPRKEYRDIIRIKKDKGYSISEQIDFEKKDPQYSESSKLGYFVVNGYSGSPDDRNGIYTFTKNAGDDITLWFCFNEKIKDINDLFGDGKVSVSNDKKTFDSDLGVDESDFGHGALFVKYINTEGTPRLVQYFDFLKAAASPSANTKIKLYEEGKYEVTLDYELKKGNTYYNYKMSFAFEIKNGNCMVFFRDGRNLPGEQGSELSNMALSNNGFYVDFAGSRDLEVLFQRSTLIPVGNGSYKEDVKENKGVNDGDAFTKDGVYVFTIHNKHTGQTVNKTIYIGSDPVFKVLSKNALSVKELNEMISKGYSFSSDGVIIVPTVQN